MTYALPYANLTQTANIKVLIKEALWTFEPAVLILFTVRQYKKKCNKRRCIAIYDTFVNPAGPWKGAFGDNSDDRCQAVITHMAAMVDWMRELRTEAARMNRFVRIKSSGNRAIAIPEFFDQLMELSHFDDGNQGCLYNMISARQPRTASGSWRTPVLTARQTLEAAGFDIKELGLNEL